ncbi:hypothetical protein CAJAP_05327 [Camponotus japonicus]
MWIFCALVGLFQLVILLMLSGILFSVAAISRLMEIMIILIYPTTVFLLRQSANLIILLTILTARMTSSAFQKLCALVKRDQYLVDQSERIPQQERIPPSPELPQFLDMQTPFVPYKRSILEEIPEDILLSKNEFSTLSAEKGIIESPQNQSQNNSSME